MKEPLDVTLIQEALLSYADEELEWASYGEFINSIYNAKGTALDIPGLGPVTIVDYHDYDSAKNYDGWTEHMFIIFQVGLGLYKAVGTYTSYTGSDWKEELIPVKPVPKTVIEYEELV